MNANIKFSTISEQLISPMNVIIYVFLSIFSIFLKSSRVMDSPSLLNPFVRLLCVYRYSY